MNWSKWFKWFGWYAAAAAALSIAFYAIRRWADLDPLITRSGRTVVGVMSAALLAWCVRGLFNVSRGEASRLSKFAQVSVITALLVTNIAGVYFSIRALAVFESDFLWIVLSGWALSWLFILLVELLRWLLSRGGSVLGVAKTVLDEAIRMKIAVAFLVLLMVILAALPFTISTEDPLRHRIQTFLTYTLMATSVLLSLMTVVLASATLAWEIDRKQIFTIATKPIGRGAHLLGKWIGIILLDAVLLGLASLAIYLFTTLYLARLRPMDGYDAQALHTEVLTSRVAVRAQPPEPFTTTAQRQLAIIEKEDPERIMKLGEDQINAAELYTATPEYKLAQGRAALFNTLVEEVEKEWRIIKPGYFGVFVFEGLQAAKTQARQSVEVEGRRVPIIQFMYKTDASTNLEDQGYEFPVVFRINQRTLVTRDREGRASFPKFVVNSAQTMPLPADAIDENGRLVVEIANVNPYNQYDPREVTLTFSSRESMEVLYHKGEFGPNFFRGILAIWFRLAFLAMLGLAAATFLSFPVAVVFALLVTVAAMASPYLMESFRMFGNRPDSFPGGVAFGLKYLGMAVATLLQKYAMYRPGDLIVDGREFSWYAVGQCALWVGVIWTAIAGGIGWLIYKNRELARVQV